MPIGEWSQVVSEEMDKFLHNNLSDEEFKDPEARESALQEQIDWYWAHYDQYVQQTVAKGKTDGMVRKVLRPIIKMVGSVSWSASLSVHY